MLYLSRIWKDEACYDSSEMAREQCTGQEGDSPARPGSSDSKHQQTNMLDGGELYYVNLHPRETTKFIRY